MSPSLLLLVILKQIPNRDFKKKKITTIPLSCLKLKKKPHNFLISSNKCLTVLDCPINVFLIWFACIRVHRIHVTFGWYALSPSTLLGQFSPRKVEEVYIELLRSPLIQLLTRYCTFFVACLSMYLFLYSRWHILVSFKLNTVPSLMFLPCHLFVEKTVLFVL